MSNKNINKSVKMEKEVKKPLMSYGGETIQPNESNIILRGPNRKPIMVFVSPVNNLFKLDDSAIDLSVKKSISHEKSVSDFPLDLSHTESIIDPVVIKSSDSPIDLLIKASQQLSTPIIKPRFDHQKVEKSFYEMPNKSNKRLYDSAALLNVTLSALPPLPDESRNLSISVKYDSDDTSNQTDSCKDSPANKKIEMDVEQFEDEITLSDEIILKPNGTSVNRKLFNAIKWNSASTATRKLLSIIYSSEFLATHSLTGRPSPAFVDRERPLKERLNPEIVEDIMFTVKSRTRGTDREIRAAITTKCADSAKKIRALKNRNK